MQPMNMERTKLMKKRLELLALSYPLDDFCAKHDIDPLVVFSFLVDEYLIDLNEYFEDEEIDE